MVKRITIVNSDCLCTNSGGFYIHPPCYDFVQVPSGVWNHLVWVYDGTYLKLYINNVLTLPTTPMTGTNARKHTRTHTHTQLNNMYKCNNQTVT